jgi:hypothetical protein
MQITFPGPDGTPITVADTRREPTLGKPGKPVSIALPQQDRRPTNWITGVMKV